MELKSSNWDNLHDLALVYMGLALGTDSVLDDSEITRISERLRAWRPDAGEEKVRQAVTEALGICLGNSSGHYLTESIRNLKGVLSEDDRVSILSHLVELAASDGVFWQEEGNYIQALRQAWEVRIDPVALASAGAQPSTAEHGNGGLPPDWSQVHDLALLYLALAFGTDGHLSDREAEIIVEKLHGWMPDAGSAEIEDVVRVVSNVYMKGMYGHTISDSIDALKQSVPAERRAAVLADLRHIATADGAIQEKESRLIHSLASAWGMDDRRK